MKVCIIGDGLVSLTLANVLIKKDLFVDILRTKKSIRYDKNRTLGISKTNIDYLNSEIINIKKFYGKLKRLKFLLKKTIKKRYLNLIMKKPDFFNY